jgi:uncharacterized protein YcbX
VSGPSPGAVSALYRYPVKSMGGEPLEEAAIDWFGVQGDRRYAFVRSEDRSDFPWLTIRQVRDMTRYEPRSAPGNPEGAPPVVRTPGGRELEVTDPALAEELAAAHGHPVWLLRDHRGLFDAFSVSVLSRQTVAAIGELAGRPLDPRRFRPTIVIDAPGGEPFPEEGWVGRTLALGDGDDAPLVRLDTRDSRCMIVNVDPDTAERDPAVLRAVARHRDACAAVYGSVVRPGTARVGAPLRLVD